MNSIQRSNLLSLKDMWFKIATDLDGFGFKVESTYYDSGNGLPNLSAPSTTLSDQGLIYVFRPEATADPVIDSQEWRLVVILDENGYDIYAVTPSQIVTDAGVFRISKYDQSRLSGKLCLNNEETGRFFSRRTNATWKTCYENNPDPDLLPISYQLNVSDHGISFYSWAEGFDRDGDCHNWFVIQRGIEKDGTMDSSIHKPLYCVFSSNGGGGGQGVDVNTLDVDGILKFVVRENDVNAPTRPLSAVIPTADSDPIINPIQQVGTTENGKYLLKFPQSFNTQRNTYETQLDMLCYTSADVIAQNENVPVTKFGEQSPRNYRAMNANFLNNKGMRLLFWTN